MSVQLYGRNVFTKEMASIFQTEVIECPDCGFEFASKHEMNDKEGLYECPACREANLEVENIKYRKAIEEALEIAKANMLAEPACSDIEVVLSKALIGSGNEVQTHGA